MPEIKYLDINGLEKYNEKVTGKIAEKANISHSHYATDIHFSDGQTIQQKIENLEPSKVMVTDSDKKFSSSSVTSTELGYLNGVTSNIQTQLNGKLDDPDLGPLSAIVTDSTGNLVSSTVTSTELSYLDGATSNIQNQLNNKLTKPSLTASRAIVSNTSGNLAVSAVTSTELGYLDGVTSNIQTQLNRKLSGSSTFVKLIYGGTISQSGTKTVDCGFTPQFCTWLMSTAGSSPYYVGGAVNFGKNGQEFRIYTSGTGYQRFTVTRSGTSVTLKKTGTDTVIMYLYAHR